MSQADRLRACKKRSATAAVRAEKRRKVKKNKDARPFASLSIMGAPDNTPAAPAVSQYNEHNSLYVRARSGREFALICCPARTAGCVRRCS